MRLALNVILKVCLWGFVLSHSGCSNQPEPPLLSSTGNSHDKSTSGDRREKFQSSLVVDINRASSQEYAPARSPVFRDAHDEFAFNFTYQNGARGKFLMPEAMGGGVGVLDVDADGYMDLFFPQGGNLVGGPYGQASLFRSIDGDRYSLISGSANLSERGYGQGAAIADFNNDGFDDIYMTCSGENVLWTSLGDGTFVNDTMAAAVGTTLWSTSAAWGDLDLDGNLDLFVCNYLKYDPLNPLACPRGDGTPAMCDPQELDPLPNSVFMNRGDGTFEEASVEMGLTGGGSKSLGVVIADLNSDFWPDVFVANDTTANFCFVNQKGRHFIDRANELGCAMSGDGAFQASMGVALGDYDRDEVPDLYVTHFSSDSNTLYRGLGSSGFSDATRLTGLHQPTLPHLGFGTVMVDFNHDGHEDLLVTNGHIDDWSYKGDPFEMPPQCFSFNGRSWDECSNECGPFFQEERIGRGIALVDVEPDGDWDPVIVHQNSPAALLLNESNDGHWIKLRLIGRDSNRHGFGVKVATVQSGRRIVQQLSGGSSYCSSHEHALIFGLGESSEDVDLQIVWPSGKQQTLSGCSVDQAMVVIEPGNSLVSIGSTRGRMPGSASQH